MSGLEKVMEELYPGYTSRKEKAKVENSKEQDKKEGTDMTVEEQVNKEAEPVKRKRRVMKPRKTKEEKSEGLLSNNMYTMAIVGTIGMEGYPMSPGEKLVIAKLTPIQITK